MKLIPFAQLNEQFGVRWSRQHIGRLTRAGLFPAPVKYGARSIGWNQQEVLDYLARAAAARKPVEGAAVLNT